MHERRRSLRKTGSKRRTFPDTPNVLVMETGLIGELLAITPALRAFRKAYPRSRVTVMVDPESAQALVGNPNVDRLLPLERKLRTGALRLTMLSTWIHAQRFDLALVFHSSFSSALMTAMGRVPRRAGLSFGGRGLLLTDAAPRDPSDCDVDEHLKVLSLLGIEPDGRELELRLTDDERARGRAILGAEEGAVAALHPGSRGEKQRWPVERFAELGVRLRDELGMRPVYLVDSGEGDIGFSIADWWRDRGKGEPAVEAPGSVRALAGAFAAVVVVVASGIDRARVAAAVGVPSVLIPGPAPAARRRPPGDRHAAVAGDAPRRTCGSPTRDPASLECMEDVSVDTVFEAVSRLVGGGAS